ncbi:MAG: GHKL domain-containing protein [Bacilli bacterium]|nr:GHKL domain-containing protein [Bacilli bacterium]
MSNIENYQEEQDLKIHEYKNQLSKITALTDDKEIIKRIEEILDVDLNADTYLLGKIKNIPKSELKSLIYYKLLVASRANLNLIINVSNEINKTNYKLDRNQYKSLSNLIGVFFDNAIEAAKESKERELYFEIYDSSVGLTILISNTYSEKINLSKIGTRGYTTKGKNRGKGLYLVKKLLDKKNRISIRTLVNDNQFVQKIIVKKE